MAENGAKVMPIEVRDVSYIYHKDTPLETVSLSNVSFSVESGEWVAIGAYR